MALLTTIDFQFLLQALVVLLFLFCSCWTSYSVSSVLFRDAATSVRFCSSAVIGYWMLVVVAVLLGGMRMFSVLPAGLLLVVASALVTGVTRGSGFRMIAADLHSVRESLCNLWRGPTRWLMLAGTVVIGARVLRGAVAPPLAWDSLTYHLVKSARWIQWGGPQPMNAPDSWSYYDYFPQAGEILWAWVMLPVRSDALLAPAGLVVLITVTLAAFMLGRELGASREHAFLAALATSYTPAVANYACSAYVDNVSLGCFLAGLAFLVRAWKSRSVASAVVACVAMALATGTKATFLPVLLASMVVVVWFTLCSHHSVRLKTAMLSVMVVACVACLTDYLCAWAEKGSPLYPFMGNEQLQAILSGTVLSVSQQTVDVMHWVKFVYHLFFWGLFRTDLEHLNLGPAGPLVIVAGFAAVTGNRSSSGEPCQS